MIDRGLLASVAVAAAVVWAAARLAPPRTQPAGALGDAAFPLVGLGVVAARLVAVALDDPAGLTQLRDLLIIRGGMHLWSGVAAAGALGWWRGARPSGRGLAGLADLAPYGLWAYAAYEATCLLRDGCFGPPAPAGLVPPGLGERQFPVGLAVAAAAAGLAVAVRGWPPRDPAGALVLAAGGLGTVRAAAALWLPKVGTGPTRQQLESLAVAVAAAAAGAALAAARRRRRGVPAAGP